MSNHTYVAMFSDVHSCIQRTGQFWEENQKPRNLLPHKGTAWF